MSVPDDRLRRISTQAGQSNRPLLRWQNNPKVSAKGEDLLEEIVRIAKEAGVPLYENAALVKSLSSLNLGDEIPELFIGRLRR